MLRGLLLLLREIAAEKTAAIAERTAAERNCARTWVLQLRSLVAPRGGWRIQSNRNDQTTNNKIGMFKIIKMLKTLTITEFEISGITQKKSRHVCKSTYSGPYSAQWTVALVLRLKAYVFSPTAKSHRSWKAGVDTERAVRGIELSGSNMSISCMITCDGCRALV